MNPASQTYRPVFGIARRALLAGLSMLTTGAMAFRSGGLCSCFHAEQDARSEKTNLFKSISVVIPIAHADVVYPIFVRLFLPWLVRHVTKLAKEFEHDVQRNSASGTRFNFGA